MNLDLDVTPRKCGKSVVRKLRREKQIPAVLYGSKDANSNFSVEEKVVVKCKENLSKNPIFTLKSSDSSINGQQAMIKDITVHPVSRRPVHVDFIRVKKGQTIKASVVIELTGKAEGLRDGGNLNVLVHEVEIEAVPSKIPEKIEHDITDMKVGDNLHVSDLKVPEGVKILTATDITLAAIAVVKEEEAAPAEAAAEGDAAAATPAGDAGKKE